MWQLCGGSAKAVSQTAFLLVGFCGLAACASRAAETYDTHYQRAVELSQSGRRNAAIAEYRAALSLRPDSAAAHNNLGAALYDSGQRAAAVQEYRQALRLNPASAEAHNNLGVALLEEQQFAAAVGEYRRAVELQPEFTAAQYNLCLGFELLGQLRDALTHCQIAARQDPERPGVADAVERIRTKLAAQ
jgi:Tfp pilus assembly protein PilF